jgi:Flp pilus assembly protein TadG
VKQASNRLPGVRTGGQKGVATVELAIILPMFGILLLGILEIGGMARAHQAVQNGAREGARFAAMPINNLLNLSNADKTTVANRIKDSVIAYLANERIAITRADIALDQDVSISVTGGDTVKGTRVTVTYTRPVLFPGIARWIALNSIRPVQGTAVFRNLY